MVKTVFITGATAGIGQATAHHMAAKGWNLILCGRREQRLQEIKKNMESKYNVTIQILCFDVSDRKACESVFAEHSEILSTMTVLVNNAGLARGVSPMDKADLNDWDEMIDTNVKGLLYITRLSLPHLKKNGNSHIVNIGSVAGRWTYPGGGVYCASKFAVRAISEGLRMDLNGTGIRVTNICPGMVETEFSEVRLKDKDKAKALYQGFAPLKAKDIADCVEWSLSRPQNVNIQEIVVYPTDQASVTQVHRA